MKSALLLVALCIVLHHFPECMGCWGRRSRRSTPTTTSRPITTPMEQCHSGGAIRTDRATGEALVDEVVQVIRNSGIFPDDNCFLRRIAYVESQFGAHPSTFRSGYYGGIWQVDDVGFADTQDTASHPGLTAKFAKIQENLCIDWTTVVWSDLRKPLYSGLAARLYLSVKPAAIPVDLVGQAKYWKEYYNTGAGAGTWQKFRDDILTSEQPGDCP